MLTLPRQHIDVDVELVKRCRHFGASLDLCQAIGGVTDQEVCAEIEIDTSTWSRIKRTGDPDYTGQTKYFPHHKLVQFMNLCGNRAPLAWLEHTYGEDPRTVRRYQSDVEAELEQERAARAELEKKLAHITEFMRGVKA